MATADLDEFVQDVLTRLLGGEGEALARLRQRYPGQATSLLNYLVDQGALPRIAGRALLLTSQGKYEAADLRQLLQPEQVRLALRRLAGGGAAPATAVLAGPDAGRGPGSEPELVIGGQVGKFVIKGLLGRGGTGTIFLATHGSLGIPVALKFFNPQTAGHRAFFAAQFRTEAMLLAQLNHPNVVRVWDFEDGPRPYIVLEYVNGDSLEKTLRAQGPLPPAAAFRYLVQVARGLRAAHRLGIIHLDVKPANVLAAQDGTVKLADFGIARLRQDDPVPADVGLVCGTFHYMAPERWDRQQDFRSDVYSLGMVAYQALSGQLPVSGATTTQLLYQHRHYLPEPLHRFVPGVSKEVADLVRRMMAKDPADRPGSYDDLLAQLDAAFRLRLETL